MLQVSVRFGGSDISCDHLQSLFIFFEGRRPVDFVEVGCPEEVKWCLLAHECVHASSNGLVNFAFGITITCEKLADFSQFSICGSPGATMSDFVNSAFGVTIICEKLADFSQFSICKVQEQ